MSESSHEIFPFRRADDGRTLVFGHPADVGPWTCSSVVIDGAGALVARFASPGVPPALEVKVMPLDAAPTSAKRLQHCAFLYRGKVAAFSLEQREGARGLVTALAESVDLRLARAAGATLPEAFGRPRDHRTVVFDAALVLGMLAPELTLGSEFGEGWRLIDCSPLAAAGAPQGSRSQVGLTFRRRSDDHRLLLVVRDREGRPPTHATTTHFTVMRQDPATDEDDALVGIAASFLLHVRDHAGLEVQFPDAMQAEAASGSVRPADQPVARSAQHGSAQSPVPRSAKECVGKVALVTGASRGIGAAVALRLASEGAAVALTARTLDTAPPDLAGTLLEVVETIHRRGGVAIAIQGDLANAASRKRIVAQCEERLGPIDVLVNNAACAPHGQLVDLPDDAFQQTFELNVRAVFDLCRLVLPGMRERRRGWIVNVSSGTARQPEGPPYQAWQRLGGHHLYAASKAAVARLTAGFAAECCADGIAVNALSTTLAVRTPGFLRLGSAPLRSDPRFEPVEAMAEAVVALCACAPSALTGRQARSLALLEELGRTIRGLDGLPWEEA